MSKFKNQPYVKHFDRETGELLNPITKDKPYGSKAYLGSQKYTDPLTGQTDFIFHFAENRRERRANMFAKETKLSKAYKNYNDTLQSFNAFRKMIKDGVEDAYQKFTEVKTRMKYVLWSQYCNFRMEFNKQQFLEKRRTF